MDKAGQKEDEEDKEEEEEDDKGEDPEDSDGDSDAEDEEEGSPKGKAGKGKGNAKEGKEAAGKGKGKGKKGEEEGGGGGAGSSQPRREQVTAKEFNPVRYDGLYRILAAWRKPGQDGHLVCRWGEVGVGWPGGNVSRTVYGPAGCGSCFPVVRQGRDRGTGGARARHHTVRGTCLPCAC